MAQNERQGASRIRKVVKARERNGQQRMVLPILVLSFIYNHKACQIHVDGKVTLVMFLKMEAGPDFITGVAQGCHLF